MFSRSPSSPITSVRTPSTRRRWRSGGCAAALGCSTRRSTPSRSATGTPGLRWFASLPGEIRDCQDRLNLFIAAVDGLPGELVLGRPARRRRRSAVKAQRHQDILVVLRRWAAELPLDGNVASGALRKRGKRARRKADRRSAEALESKDDAMLHRARKAAERADMRPNWFGPWASRSVRSEPSCIASTSRTSLASIKTPRSPSRPCAGWAPRRVTFRRRTASPSGCCAREERIAHECHRRARRLSG